MVATHQVMYRINKFHKQQRKKCKIDSNVTNAAFGFGAGLVIVYGGEAIVTSAPAGISGIGGALSKGWDKVKNFFGVGSSEAQSLGKAFDPMDLKIQIGVDPTTLTSMKDLSTLDPNRLANAVKFGGDKTIIVDKLGRILDGHHRLLDAIQNGHSVDIQIGY